MLDFSGRHELRDVDYRQRYFDNKWELINKQQRDYFKGSRQVDHRDILDIYPNKHEWGEGMVEFMRSGAIRVSIESLGFEAMNEVTDAQKDVIASIALNLNLPVIILEWVEPYAFHTIYSAEVEMPDLEEYLDKWQKLVRPLTKDQSKDILYGKLKVEDLPIEDQS
jgi:hypothetical protein